MKINLYKLGTILLILILISACDKEMLDEKPPHIITAETLYTTLAGFETGLNGLYAQVRREKEQSIGSHAMMGSMFITGTDNIVTNHHNPGFYQVAQYWRDHNNPNHNEITLVFNWLYGVINAANTIINRAENVENVDWSGGGANEAENKNRVIAEARAIRAWAYRHLSYGWGDVPLTLVESSGSTIRTDWERTPIAEVRKQIIEDFLFAEAHIGVEPSVQGRITKGAIQHYIAEMYLAMKDYTNALSYANKVINTPQYQLITERYGVRSNQPGVPFMDMFWDGNSNREQGNSEALWVHQFGLQITGGGAGLLRRFHLSRFWNISVDGVRPVSHTYDRGGLGYGRGSFTKWALDIYEPQDDRFSEHAIRKFFVLGDAQTNAPYPADNLPPGWSYGDTLWLDWSEDITYQKRGRANWPFSRKAEGTDPNNTNEHNNHNDQVYLRLADTYL
jgi:starch-binding outer membrane protein, SusD/RagB family